MTRPVPITLTTAALLLALGAPRSPAQTGLLIREIAASGQPAQGLPTTVFDAVGSPRLNASGQVLFWSRLRGGSVGDTTEDSLWTDRGGPLELVARAGDLTTTGPGDFISGLPAAALNDAGFIALVAAFLPGGATTTVTRLAVFREDEGGTFILRAIEAVNALTLPSLIPLSGRGEGIFREDTPKDNRVLALSGAQASLTPGTPVPGRGVGTVPADATFRQFSDTQMNTTGEFVFRAAIGTTAATPNWRYALFANRGGTLARIATVGEVTPGGPDQRLFTEISADPQIDESGTIAYWATFTDPAIPAGPNTAIYADLPGGTARAIAVAGQSAPGTDPATFASFSRTVHLGAGGRLAFTGFLTGDGITASNNSGLWVADPGRPPRLLVREGDAAPGSPDAVFAILGAPHVGPNGQIAFAASLAGADVTQSSSSALFATDARGEIRMLARVGAAFPLGQASTVTVRRIGFDHGGPGHAQMNAAGEIAFTLLLSDSSSRVVVVGFPCPADFNRDGGVDGGDVESFFLAWEAADSNADVNEDGGVDGADVESFFILWEAGGC